MLSADPTTPAEAWNRLALYRERYDIEDMLGAINGLGRSIQRRQVRLKTARNRVRELQTLLAEANRELTAIETEIEESRRVGVHAIEEILDQVRVRFQEAWTPTPVRGFRMWQVNDGGLYGATETLWSSPIFEAECLRKIPGNDIPHSESRCGPPACGVYATKHIDMFPPRASGQLEGRLGSHQAIGVVAMTGKVIEHSDGYRSARVTVVAIVARVESHWLQTDDHRVIEDLFHDPKATIRTVGKLGIPEDHTIDAFLNQAREKEETWISDPN